MLQLIEALNKYVDENKDPRVENWLFMSSLKMPILITVIYLAFVKLIGPQYMKNRPVFDLRNTLFIYNIYQICINSYIAYKTLSLSYFNNYSFHCQPMDYSTDPVALEIAYATWLFYLSKYFDLLDTVFMILRKKSKQITTLHVTHHGSLLIGLWYCATVAPGGHSVFAVCLNSLIHVIMYTYYLLASFGPTFQKYLWWKQYVTALQVIQLALIIIHNILAIVSDCTFPKVILLINTFQTVFFFILFVQLYFATYKKKTV